MNERLYGRKGCRVIAEKLLETGKHFSERQAEKEMEGRSSVLKDLADSKKQVEHHHQKAGPIPERGGPVL